MQLIYNCQDTIIKHKFTYDTSYSHNNILHSSTDNTSHNESLTRQNLKIPINKVTSHILQKENLQKENSLLQSTYSHNRLSSVTSQPILQKRKEIMQNTISPTILSTKAKDKNITHATSASILSPTSGNIHIATRQQDKHSMTSLTSNYQFHNHTYLDKKTNYLKSIWSDKHYKEK